MQEENRKQNDRNNEDVDTYEWLNKLVEGRTKNQTKCDLIIDDQFEVIFQIDTGASINMLPEICEICEKEWNYLYRKFKDVEQRINDTTRTNIFKRIQPYNKENNRRSCYTV